MRDADIRPALRALIAKPNTTILEEVGIDGGAVRADVLAVTPASMTCFEIKSDSDTIKRLAAQAAAYGRVFEQLVLVAGPRHITKALEVIPAWWGVVVAEGGPGDINLVTLREPQPNEGRDQLHLAAMLWRHEMLELLDGLGQARGIRSANRDVIRRRLCDTFDLEQLAAAVRTRLLERGAGVGCKGLT